jgi:transcriptional regulator with XRE-family HTH domain
MEIGTRIKRLRTERKLSQEAVAEKLNLSRQAVAKWESGVSMPSTANLMALCEVFGISLNELTAPDAPEPKRDSKSNFTLRAILLSGSVVFILLSVIALFVSQDNPLPQNVIGYADAETGIAVHGTPFPVYLLCAVTAVWCIVTAVVFFRARRKGKRK